MSGHPAPRLGTGNRAELCYNPRLSANRNCRRDGSSLRLSKEEVEHVALLARLDITDEEKARYTEELNQILAHFDKLNELDTSGVPPTSHVIPMTNVFRKDEVKPSLPVESVLANAPDATETAFRVPRVVEEG